jgi:hypothetical protein
VSAAEAAWEALHGEGRHEAGWHLRRIHVAAPCEVFAGLRQPGEVLGLVLEVPIEAVPADIDLPQSRGFSLEAQLLVPSHGGRVRFSLTLTDPAYKSVFAVLCDHVAEAAAAAPTPRLGLREWLRQLHVWQDFMARHGPGGRSNEAVLGLIGELVVLKDQLVPRLGGDAAVVAWAGPRGEPNDFEFAGGYLEVKATSRQAPDTIQISNLDQLDDRRGAIMLANVRLRPDPGGASLPGLVSAFRQILATGQGRSLAEFNARLIAAGYVDVHADLYPSAWATDRIDLYTVRADFPRLTHHDVRVGVRSCSYSIVIADCASYLATTDDLDALVGPRAHG